MLDKNLIGHSFGQRQVNVEEWAVRWYANAIGETNPEYSNVAVARAAGLPSLRVPPTFLSCPRHAVGRLPEPADHQLGRAHTPAQPEDALYRHHALV
ncbi:MaoC family dehydratase N-terminal domain-containing protein [Cupriavidus sp. 2MCAB6]|uniref:FAS1-like dehydratase domain-containing protein n=1 Tax=Cupriavidus sp. 2MCAB6 TaxID=3232981 RepID=UPI003F93C398